MLSPSGIIGENTAPTSSDRIRKAANPPTSPKAASVSTLASPSPMTTSFVRPVRSAMRAKNRLATIFTMEPTASSMPISVGLISR